MENVKRIVEWLESTLADKQAELNRLQGEIDGLQSALSAARCLGAKKDNS